MNDVSKISAPACAPRIGSAAYMVAAGEREAIPGSTELIGLMRRVAETRDMQAFAALFRFYAPRLKSFLLRQGFNDAESEDLIQETMMNLWRRAESFDPVKAGVSTWIFTIARNCGIDRRRRTSRFVSSPAEQDLDEPDDSPSAEDRLIGWQNEAAVRAALTQLPEDQATVIRMSFYADSAQAEIAEQLGIPLGTVKSRVRLALQRLRRIMMEDTK